MWSRRRFDRLFGGTGSDTLDGGTGMDSLVGGSGGADLFGLGNASTYFHNDAYTSQIGNTDYALIRDLNPSASDRLHLNGSAGNDRFGAHTVSGVSGDGLFRELGTTDELIAIIQPGAGAQVLTWTNVIDNAVFV